MRYAILGLALFTACSTASPTETIAVATTAATSDTTSTTQATETSTTLATTTEESPTTTVPAESSADLAVFIAALEAGLKDTRYAGTALSDPEVYIATGQLFCEELDLGADPALMLSDYLDILTEGDIESADDDDLIVAGLLLGVAVEVMCPEHSGALTAAGF